MTVLDTSAVVDLLQFGDAAIQVRDIMARERDVAAVDVVVFEVLAVFRRDVLRDVMSPARAAAAIDDLGDVKMELFPAMSVRHRAWELRHNLTTADALFVALAERLDEPLATKDRRLIAAARQYTNIEIIELAS